jgi:hypothetical protein
MTFEYSSAHDLIDAPDLAFDTGSGRATWDERGNSIWEWQTAPGVYSREISAQQLQALEASHLHLLDGTHANSELTIWSRNARTRTTRPTQPTETILPQRGVRADKGSGFDHFLKKLGLPA